jgi:hypothetical protein
VSAIARAPKPSTFAVAGALIVLSGRVSALTPLAVPLALDEPAGVARHAFPASASVPLPRGRLRPGDPLWLAAADGRPALVQTEALERWPDGTVRWLLVDFLADVPRGGQTTYTLRSGKAPGKPPGAEIARRDGGRLLDAGPLRVTAGAEGLVRLEADGVPPVPLVLAPLALDGGGGGAPGAPSIAVETDGPVRTELLLRGRYPSGVDYEARCAVFAGQPFVRVRLTVTDVADAPFLALRSLALDAPGAFERAAVGLDGRGRRFASLDPPHELVQPDSEFARLDDEPGTRRGDGWARAIGGEGAVTVVAPAFWEEYPKAFGLQRARLRLDLFAGRDAPVQFGTGAAKTHELWVALEPLAHASTPSELAIALGAPLVALPPADWIVASRALPQALAPGARGARDFLARFAESFTKYRDDARKARWDDGPPVACTARKAEHPRTGYYGAFNWGDWNFPGYRDTADGCDAWGNLEYDLSQVLGLAWAATGSRMFLDAFLPTVRHYRDVDIIHHYAARPDWVGLNHPHTNMHFTFGTPANVDLGHVWTEGLVTHWRLTGEKRSLQAARGLADALLPFAAKANNPRKFGWPMVALMSVYDATGERKYLDAARSYATRAMETYKPSPDAADWKIGILADGLAMVDAASHDPAIRRWLTSYADRLAADPGKWPDLRFTLPMGYLAVATNNANYERLALGTSRTLPIGPWGKPLAIGGRTGFRLLGPLAASAPVTPDRAAPPPASPPARRPPSPTPRAPARR